MLPHGLTEEALEAAAAEPEPDSLAASTRLRRLLGPELAAAAATQVMLRCRARKKFGSTADTMLFTRDGLEQATRPEVAAHHAARLVAAGVHRVADLGCGIGTDAGAFLDAGLDVVAVEQDQFTAEIAAYNLGARRSAGHAEVMVGDAELLAGELLRPGTAAFCDPARRDAAGRRWRTQDFTPAWSFVVQLLRGDRVTGIKLGPALPHSMIPAAVEAEWVSHHGETVEVGLWAGPGAEAGARAAMIWPDSRLVVRAAAPEVKVSAPLRFVYEPDGSVIRAGAVTLLADQLGAAVLDPHIAYLTSDAYRPTPYAAVFEVAEILPYQEKVLRQWVRDRRIGVLEIKKRGIDIDPAALRAKLRPKGPERATLILSRAPGGAVAIVARRC